MQFSDVATVCCYRNHLAGHFCTLKYKRIAWYDSHERLKISRPIVKIVCSKRNPEDSRSSAQGLNNLYRTTHCCVVLLKSSYERTIRMIVKQMAVQVSCY